MSNDPNLDVLQQRAAEQRTKIHQSVQELKQLRTSVEANVREKLDPKRQAREHFWAAAGIAGFLGLMLGHGIAGVFVE
jgi:ElaB/YqjD/DUF883 family membrane-anchored ribosome-binding protein